MKTLSIPRVAAAGAVVAALTACGSGPSPAAQPCGPGEIVLMHVGSNPNDHTTFDADTLLRVISGLRARGYFFVTLDALTG